MNKRATLILSILGSVWLNAQQGTINFYDSSTAGVNSIGPHDSNQSLRINGEKNVDIVIDEASQYLDGAFNIFNDGPSVNPLFKVKRDGRVGIGTDSPSTFLHVNSSTSAARLTISGAGNAAINAGVVLQATSDTNYRGLGVFMHDSGGQNEWFIGRPYAGSDQLVINRRNNVLYPDVTTSSFNHNNTSQTTTNLFTVKSSGNVGIGTTAPDAKLAVNGNIHAKEVKVDLTGWPDYVFQSEHRIPTLEEVEKHITEKGHLINIPSAKEVEENGLVLGEMNKLLLEKIEELFLYTIQQEKRLSEMNEKYEKQGKEIEELKMSIEKLRK